MPFKLDGDSWVQQGDEAISMCTGLTDAYIVNTSSVIKKYNAGNETEL